MRNPRLVVFLAVVICFTFGCQKQSREKVPAEITEAEAKIIAQKYVDSRNTVNLALRPNGGMSINWPRLPIKPVFSPLPTSLGNSAGVFFAFI
jgi:hypothetical protein